MQEYMTSSQDGRVWGSYVHGLFDSDEMRDALIAWIRGSQGSAFQTSFSYRVFKEQNYDLLADTVERQVDVESILKRTGL